MLIPIHLVKEIIDKYNIPIHSLLHIGSNLAQEKDWYNTVLKLKDDNIIWIDALQSCVNECKKMGIPHIYQAVISNKDDEKVNFHITNNIESSSIFPLKEHLKEHPHIHVTNIVELTTTRLDTFIDKSSFDPSKINFLMADIQQGEYNMLLGYLKYLKYCNLIYLEVNEKELYDGGEKGLIQDIDKLLDENGFVGILEKKSGHGWNDKLYIKKIFLENKK